MGRQVKWLSAQCECEELDGAGLCPACGIAATLLNTHDNARLMQTMTGEWVWAKQVDASHRPQPAPSEAGTPPVGEGRAGGAQSHGDATGATEASMSETRELVERLRTLADDLSKMDLVDSAADLREAADRLADPVGWCQWSSDENGAWHTACGRTYEFTAGGPSDNGQQFCGYCGLRLREVPHD